MKKSQIELMAAEPKILDHMNEDHPEAVDLYAQHLVGRPRNGLENDWY